LTSVIERRLSLHQRLARKQEECEELKSQNQQLQALATLGSATSMIAHEINNLLTPLGAYAALAVQNPQDRELAERVLARTVGNCRRASEIMESLLQMANGQEQRWDHVHARKLVEDVFTCLCRDFHKDGIAVVIDVPEELRMYCVAVQIQQVLMNLLLNARDAMLPGGGRLRVAAAQDGQEVVVQVQDTGRGIAAENLRNIFRPFFTTKSADARPTANSGSGVGLAFCRQVVEAHAGRIDVESEPGRGSTFTIRLPQT
jgi:signal transduction histidine kinase